MGVTPAKALVLGTLTMILISLLAVQAAARDINLTNQDNGRTFKVKVGDKIMVNLRDPGGGGYQFLAPQFDAAVLQMMGERHIPQADSRRMGDFGRQVYEFQAMKEGQTTLLVSIKRPWEKQSETYLKVKISVRP